MSKIREALQKAQGDADQLQAKVTHWQGVADAKRRELTELEAGVGERLFDDESGSALREYAAARTDLAAAIEGAQAAAEVADRKLRAAQRELKAAQAAELREQARTVRADAEQRQARVDELVAQLEEFEGGGWRPWQPSREELASAGAAGVRVSARKTPPMFAEADRLDAQAAKLEEQVAAEQRETAPAVPHAVVHWNGQHYKGSWSVRVDAGLNEGVGSVTFEVTKDGQLVDSFVLPDGGSRAVRKHIEGFGDGVVEVRADGQVLGAASVELPAGSFNDGRGRPAPTPAFQ